MRVATSTLHQIGYQGIAKNQTELYQLEAEFSSGKKINSASDDPAGAVQAANLSSAKSINDQFGRNQTNAQNHLQYAESIVGNIDSAMQSVQETLVSAGNASLSASDRKTMATQLQSLRDQLMNLANTKDESGHYIFAGYSESTTPFTQDAAGNVSYNGDNGVRSLQVSQSVTMATNVSGADLFMGVKGGNGVIATAAGAANTGAGSTDGGSVISPTAYDGSGFQVTFSGSGSSLQYSVVNTTTGATVLSAQPYTAGSAIQIPLTSGGSPVVSMTISGTPAAGDTFSLTAAPTTNVFTALNTAIAALNGNASGSVSSTQMADAMRRAEADVGQSYDRVLSERGQLGNALDELQRQVDVNTSANTDIQSRLSSLVDLDYNKAASDLAQAQLAYQATQKVYSQLGKQSLFDYL